MMELFRDPIWEIMDVFANPYRRDIQNSGLKAAIRRPHNLVDIRDSEGNIIAQRLEVVTTPFKKDDVKVSILDNVLSVQCGTENIKDEENEDYIYRGVSSQSYSFSLKLAQSVDQSKITAENKDGMLKIVLPSKIIEEKKPEAIEIKVD